MDILFSRVLQAETFRCSHATLNSNKQARELHKVIKIIIIHDEMCLSVSQLSESGEQNFLGARRSAIHHQKEGKLINNYSPPAPVEQEIEENEEKAVISDWLASSTQYTRRLFNAMFNGTSNIKDSVGYK